MNRRSLLASVMAMVAVSACQPSAVPAAQEKTYARDVLVRMWNVVTDMRENGYAKPGLTPEEAKARIERAMVANDVHFPALIEPTTPGGDPIRLVNMMILRNPENDQLRLVFEYPGRPDEKRRGEIHSNPLLVFKHPTPAK
jgi:hypothetical protein